MHMCECCCTCVAYVCAYMREKVMFEVYGGESESMSYQCRIFVVFSHLLSILHFAYDSFYAGLSCFYIVTLIQSTSVLNTNVSHHIIMCVVVAE